MSKTSPAALLSVPSKAHARMGQHPPAEFHMKSFLVILLALAAPLSLRAQSERSIESAVNSITSDDFYQRIGVIAHDSMRGRDTPSPELEKTAKWIAGEFERFGLRPAGEQGSYFQRYAINTIQPDFATSGASTNTGVELGFGTDLTTSFRTPSSGESTGGVVVVTGSEGGFDALDVSQLAGMHVILVADPGEDGLAAPFARQVSRAIRRTEALSVIVATNKSDAEWDADVAERESRVSTGVPWRSGRRALSLLIRDQALARLLSSEGMDPAALRARAGETVQAQKIDGLVLTVSFRTRLVQEQSAPNVIGILEGSDPELRDEFVVFSGHMDHVGVGRPNAEGDSIYNGADDDASGTVGVVEIAEAMSMLDPRPKRSMLFILVSGEEKGLLGSDYFTDHPTVPIEQMVAGFNTDMIGRNWPDTIVAIGREHSSLGETLSRVNDAHPELGMTAIDDPWPEQSFYTRSDHFNFARKGVPILFFFNGVHDDYHQPSDELELIDTDKAARIARLVFWLGLDVANARERPRWNPESFSRFVSDR